ncbi:MAG: chorismate synthase [Bacteroidales bacterium]|nr:chorismate synthase [Bacteroidales bacterium]
MSNTIGTHFKLTAYGESHGPAIGGVIDGCPSGIEIDRDFIASEMARRHEGAYATPRREPDEVEILSGVYEGRTLGTPIAFTIRNNDVNSDDYRELAGLYRPGHADYTYEQRYGLRDHRGGGRASGRITASFVAAGAIAKMMLRNSGIKISATLQNCPVPPEGDSSGGIIECTVTGVPAGIGNPVFDKLNARLAAAMMSIPSAIGFEMGAGFEAAQMTGSEYRDEWDNGFLTKSNHCGGIQGGISNGMPIVFRVAFHPAVTINQPTECIDSNGQMHTLTPQGRHDRNHLPRTVVVVEAMAALTMADFITENGERRT